MHQPATPRPVVILGPTAAGKSDLAVALAEALGGPARCAILGADSMQVYRYMDAGTAKPTREQRDRIAHHLIDIVEPTERFTVADWLERADALIARLQAESIRPIIVGGTNLYIKALLEGMFDAPDHDPTLRAELESLEVAELHRRLRKVDPAAAERIHPNDRKRLTRALEVYTQTGRPISELQKQWPAQTSISGGDPHPDTPRYRHNPVMIGLDRPLKELHLRTNRRVKLMFRPDTPGVESLPDETRRLDTAGVLGDQARHALGYKQVLEHLDGRCTLEEAFERTKILTRRFVKNQHTWLRRFENVRWITCDDQTEMHAVVADAHRQTTAASPPATRR